MNDLIKRHYSGNNAKEYDAKRKSDKWKAESKFVEDFLTFHSEVKTVIDAPLGTNRFARKFAELGHIQRVYGLELSDDMLNEAKSDDAGGKLDFVQCDLLEEFPHTADAVLMIRMLNLLNQEKALIMFENALKAATQYVLISLRIGNPTVLERKIHVQEYEVFDDKAVEHGFEVYDWVDVPTSKYGDYCLITYSKVSDGKTHNGQTD